MAKVVLPHQLSHLTGDLSRLEFDCDSLSDALHALCARFPRFAAVLLDGEKRVSPFIGLFVDGQQFRASEVADVRVSPSSEIHIVAAVAGG